MTKTKTITRRGILTGLMALPMAGPAMAGDEPLAALRGAVADYQAAADRAKNCAAQSNGRIVYSLALREEMRAAGQSVIIEAMALVGVRA